MKERFEAVMSIVLENVSKKFEEFYALKRINLEFFEGEVHVILGKNGSGKTTLTKVINGTYQPSEGKVIINGKAFSSLNPLWQSRLGFSLCIRNFCTFRTFLLQKISSLKTSRKIALDLLALKR